MTRPKPDPMEKIMRDALDREGFVYTQDGRHGGEANNGLDFFLPDYGVHIEVKQFHSARIADQMSRAPNVIAVQGRDAVEFFAALLCDFKRRMTATGSK